MASLRQILADAPKPSGSRADRRDALKLGLAGTGLLLPDEEMAEATDRAAQWNSSLKPINAFEVFLVDLIATNSLRIERCHHHESILRQLKAARAGLCWDDDRRLDAEELGLKLPKTPTTIARQLRRTRQGCDLLIERWEALGRIHQANGAWSEAQRALVLDMLSVAPELRDGPTPLDADPHALVQQQIDRLQGLQADVLADLDRQEQLSAELGMGALDRELAQVRRYEQSCSKRLEWAFAQLKKGRHEHREDPLDPVRLGPILRRSQPAPAPQAEAAPPPAVQDSAAPPAPIPPPSATRSMLDELQAQGYSPASRLKALLFGQEPATAAPVGNRHDRRAAEAKARRRD